MANGLHLRAKLPDSNSIPPADDMHVVLGHVPGCTAGRSHALKGWIGRISRMGASSFAKRLLR